jgi:hypothetical protein
MVNKISLLTHLREGVTLPMMSVESFYKDLSIPKIGLQKTDINCNPNLVQNDNKT